MGAVSVCLRGQDRWSSVAIWFADIGEGDSHHLGRRWRRGQSSFRRSPFRRGVRGIPSQQSGSMNANLEVFTSWATHASSRQRFIGPAAPGMHPSAPVPFLRRGDSREGDSHHLGGHVIGVDLRIGVPTVSNIRSQPTRSIIVHLQVFATWAPHASPLHRSIDPTARGMHPSAPVSFLRMGVIGEGDSHHLGGYHLGVIGEGDSHHLGGYHLGVVSRAFPVNNRGR